MGNWILFAHAPGFDAYRGIFISVHLVFMIFVTSRLVLKFYKEGFAFRSIPVAAYIFCGLFSIFRVLELSIDCFFLFHRIPYWARYLLFWFVRLLLLFLLAVCAVLSDHVIRDNRRTCLDIVATSLLPCLG